MHLHVDGKSVNDHRPSVRLWLRYRTEFETVCKRLKIKPVERRYVQHGTREWNAEGDTPTRRLLVSCASLSHHPDWEPRADRFRTAVDKRVCRISNDLSGDDGDE